MIQESARQRTVMRASSLSETTTVSRTTPVPMWILIHSGVPLALILMALILHMVTARRMMLVRIQVLISPSLRAVFHIFTWGEVYIRHEVMF